MAQKSTIYKAALNISDMDRGYYHDHNLTIALHPSETEERMMVRLVAFALFADEYLAFTRGISTDDEPDLWQKSLSDEIELWIDLGAPDEKRVRKACGRSKKTVIILYHDRHMVWWQQHQHQLTRFENLDILQFEDNVAADLLSLCQRSMQLQVTIQDGDLWISNGEHTVLVRPKTLKGD